MRATSSDFAVNRDTPQGTIFVTLRYVDRKPVLTQLKRVSKPGLRVYTRPRRDSARARRPGHGDHLDAAGRHDGPPGVPAGLGGEVLCYVW